MPTFNKVETKWVTDETQQSQAQTYTLQTSGKYVDKDIELNITARTGSVKLNNKEIEIEHQIMPNGSNYLIITQQNENLAPSIVNEGWVAQKDLTAGTLTLAGSTPVEKTILNKNLVASDIDLAGYSAYRVTASKGYNDTVITEDISVYQGDFSGPNAVITPVPTEYEGTFIYMD